MSDTQPLHSMKLDKYTLRVEHNDLGITIVDEKGNTVCWLNCIGTAVLKEWLKDFDPKGRMANHQSVKEHLEEQ
jgi:hypothetical protein